MSYIKQLTKINLGQRMIHSTRDEQKAAAVLLGQSQNNAIKILQAEEQQTKKENKIVQENQTPIQ